MGGKQGASVSIHTITSQTWPLCRHTPPHNSSNRARQQVNTQSAHLTSLAPASHQVPYRSITEVAVSTEEAVKVSKRKKGGPGWNCRETLINIGGDSPGNRGEARMRNGKQRKAAKFLKSKTAAVAVHKPPPLLPNPP